MSRAVALRFFEAVASSTELQNELRALRPHGDLEAVAGVAAAHGFACTADDLQAGFVTDWKMRRYFYTGRVEETTESGTSGD